MQRIIKDEEPDFWKTYRRRNPKCTYNDLDKNDNGKAVRRKIRGHMIKQQNYICAYCCKRINEDSAANEHIRPKGDPKYMSLSMDYNNLVASCKTFKTCTMKKDNEYSEELFISPLDEDCESHFEYFPDGSIRGITEKGKYTIELLGLNEYSLKDARKCQYASCESMRNKQLIYEYYIKPYDGKKRTVRRYDKIFL